MTADGFWEFAESRRTWKSLEDGFEALNRLANSIEKTARVAEERAEKAERRAQRAEERAARAEWRARTAEIRASAEEARRAKARAESGKPLFPVGRQATPDLIRIRNWDDFEPGEERVRIGGESIPLKKLYCINILEEWEA